MLVLRVRDVADTAMCRTASYSGTHGIAAEAQLGYSVFEVVAGQFCVERPREREPSLRHQPSNRFDRDRPSRCSLRAAGELCWTGGRDRFDNAHVHDVGVRVVERHGHVACRLRQLEVEAMSPDRGNGAEDLADANRLASSGTCVKVD